VAEHTITIQGLQYKPSPAMVVVGDSVKWVNRDSMMHDAHRDEAPTFRTKLLAKNETSDPIVFDQATGAEGIEYSCTPHPFMKGKIIVAMAGSDPAGYTREGALHGHNIHVEDDEPAHR
jgi:plastocyanin